MSTFVFKKVGCMTLLGVNGVELQGVISTVKITSEPHLVPEITLTLVPHEGWEIAFEEANIHIDTSQLTKRPLRHSPGCDPEDEYCNVKCACR